MPRRGADQQDAVGGLIRSIRTFCVEFLARFWGLKGPSSVRNFQWLSVAELEVLGFEQLGGGGEGC